MKVHSITREELDRFVRFPGHPNGESEEEFIQEMWAKELSQPEFFFLLEKEDRLAGRVAYWRLKSRPEEARMIFFNLPWEGDYLSSGLQLLLESWERLKRSSVRQVARRLVSSWDYLEEQIEVMEHAGISLLQEKISYQLGLSEASKDPENRLTYRSLEETGEEAYVEAIRRVTEGTPDREIQAMGGEQAAPQLLAILKEDTVVEPGWLQLAYEPEGELVGLVAPVRMPDNEEEGAIGLIGVVPEKRGLGYIHELLARGAKVLREGGVARVYVETDTVNSAMRRALERAGYREVETAWLYRGNIKNL